MAGQHLQVIAKVAAALALASVAAFVVLSFATATTPDGTPCGNFWGGIDIDGCDSDRVRGRAMAAFWLAAGCCVIAATAAAWLAISRRGMLRQG